MKTRLGDVMAGAPQNLISDSGWSLRQFQTGRQVTPGRKMPAIGNHGILIPDAGAATAEFAVVTMAAVGFAGLLVVILRSEEVRAILTDLVRNALTIGF